MLILHELPKFIHTHYYIYIHVQCTFTCLLDRDVLGDISATVGTNGQLILPSVDKNHEGEWSCQVINTFGSNEVKFKSKLIVKSFEG